MAAIIEGQQYALSSQYANKGQSMVFVKLTDSALKAIEDYAAAVSKGNVSPTFKPSIEFRPNNSQGVITIPTKVSNNESEKQLYNFSIKDIQNDGILECIEQNHNKTMESLGKVMLRMQIHANDDSYRTTKVKMAVAAEQEHKKYNTKVIQSSDPNVGRKVKVKRPPYGLKHPPAPPSAYPSMNQGNVSNTTSSMYKQQPPSSSTTSLSSMPRFTKFSNNVGNNQSKPMNNNINNNNSYHNNNGIVSESTKKSIREQLVHMLALRPMKLSDILIRVQDKFKETLDKTVIFNVLTSLATAKDGATYYLNDSSWDEVQMDWLHYSKEERDIVHKRNPLLTVIPTINNQSTLTTINTTTTTITPVVEPIHHVGLNGRSVTGHGNNLNGNSISPLSDGSVRSQSSPSSACASPRSLKSSPYKANTLKRNTDITNGNNGLKKFKSDNIRHVPNTTSNGNGKPYSSSNANSYSSPLDKLNNIISDHESPESRNHSFISNSNCYKSSMPLIHDSSNLIGKKGGDSSNDRETFNGRMMSNPYQRISGNGSGSINSTPNSSPDSGISHVGNVLSSDSSHADSDDYLSKYIKIQSNEQLSQYKADFYAEYPEYRRLYDYVEGVSREFENLRESILSKEEESEEWHDLIRQTIEKYNEVKHKSRYHKAQKRLNYLHYKLLHIKNLISEYNRNQEKGASNLARFGSSQIKS